MAGLLPNIDPDGLLEYSVVYTDRSLNHMSNSFQKAMNDVSSSLKKVYSAESVVLVPGGGTYGMEAVARQFATNADCLVIRNGWFSYRWSQILEMGNIPSKLTVLKASRKNSGPQEPFSPVEIDKVVARLNPKNQKSFLLLMLRHQLELFFLMITLKRFQRQFIQLEDCSFLTASHLVQSGLI